MDRQTAESATLPAAMGRGNNIQLALNQAIDQLRDSPSSSLDAEVLLCHVLHERRSYLLSWPEKSLSEEQQSAYQALLDRRSNGEPIAYITGEREFWSLPFKVNKHTLIPRPETELLVEAALELGDSCYKTNRKLSIVDLGTGSGCIALSLAKERPDWQIYAIDCSQQALEIARQNATALATKNVCFMQSNWFDELGKTACFDLVLANPPYIAEGAPHLLQGDVRFEPRLALVSGKDGLDDIRTLANESFLHLNKNGWVIFEVGYNQASEVAEIVYSAGFNYVFFKKDLAGIKRHCIAHRP